MTREDMLNELIILHYLQQDFSVRYDRVVQAIDITVKSSVETVLLDALVSKEKTIAYVKFLCRGENWEAKTKSILNVMRARCVSTHVRYRGATKRSCIWIMRYRKLPVYAVVFFFRKMPLPYFPKPAELPGLPRPRHELLRCTCITVSFTGGGVIWEKLKLPCWLK